MSADQPPKIIPPDAALRLAAIVESSDDAIVSKDLNGTITSWNRGAERLFGYSAEEAIGRSITMLIPTERLPEEDVVLSKIRRGERVEHFDTMRRRKDGTLFDISLTVSPIRDASGTIIGASKIARDISERKRIENELDELQRRLMALANASASLLASTEVDAVLSGTIELARDVIASDGYALWRADASGVWRVARAHGLSEEFLGAEVPASTGGPDGHDVPFADPKPSADVLGDPTLAHRHEIYEREGIASLIAFPLTIRGRRSASLVFYSRRPRDYAEVDVKAGAALANVAAASLTTAELYEEERRARQAADQAHQHTALLAEAGATLGASLDYEATLAAIAQLAVPMIADWCAVEILTDRGLLQRLAVAHVDPDKVQLANTIEERYPTNPDAPGGAYETIRTGRPAFLPRIPRELIDVRIQDEEHRRLIAALNPVSFMCVPLTTQGRAFGAISFLSAESGREFTEADLQVARELAARASLAVEHARAYMRANEASRIKDEFLATLSHELRTPLNAVLGYTRMLRLGSLSNDKAQAALDVVERNATSLRQIIEDVLDVSRIVAGRLRLNVQTVDLAAVLGEATATVAPAAEAKGVHVEARFEPDTPTVWGDPERIQQIVWNLLSNAIKFTGRGGEVQLHLGVVESNVEIRVTDTGRGIEAAFLPYVFERFRQADATFSREQGGLGLGLAIAKQLTELHGGTISAASAGAGHGATFTVSLPIRAVHSGADVLPAQPPRDEQQAPDMSLAPHLDGIKVLAVDDEPDSLSLLRTVLEAAGAAVTTCTSSVVALTALPAVRPDVIIADIGMPDVNGFAFIRSVRELEEPLGSTPAAALTAYARAHDRASALSNGFQLHLVKPIEPVELISAVAKLAARAIGA